MLSYGLLILILLISFIHATPTTYLYQPPDGYSSVWSDEFDGTSIDTNQWNHEITCTPFNNEQQCYTADTNNSFVHNGMLNIIARQRTPIPSNANNQKYTSARLVTSMNFRYGTFVAKIKGPFGKGIWPAFWLLGVTTPTKSWPWVGEIDIMEYRGGSDPGGDDTNSMTLHFARGSVSNGTDVAGQHVYYGRSMALQNGARYADAFHIFEAIWTPTSITGRVDGIDVFYINSTNTDHFNEFNNQAGYMNIILNVAVGGTFTNGVVPDDDPTYAQTMLVDWVRVYQQSPGVIKAITSIPWIIPTPPVKPTGVVNFIDSEVPLSIAPRGTLSIKVAYNVSHPSMLVLEVITHDSTIKYGFGTKMVTPGASTDTIILAISTLIDKAVELRVYCVDAETYIHNVFTAWQYALSPFDTHAITVGTSMSYNAGIIPIPTPNPDGVLDVIGVGSALVNGITMNNPIKTLTSQQSYNVNLTYTTNVPSQILIDLVNTTTKTKPASGNITVNAGTGIISIPMIWLTKEIGATYFYNMYIINKTIWDANPTTAFQKPSIGPIMVQGISIIASTPTTPPPAIYGVINNIGITNTLTLNVGQTNIPVTYTTNTTCYLAMDVYSPQGDLIATVVRTVKAASSGNKIMDLQWLLLNMGGPNYRMDLHFFPQSVYDNNANLAYQIYPAAMSISLTLTFPTFITFNVIPDTTPVFTITWNTPVTVDVLYSAPADSVIVIYLQHATKQPVQRVATGTLNVPASGQTAATVNMIWNSSPVPSNSFVLVGYLIDATIYNTDPTNAYLQAPSQQTSNPPFTVTNAQLQANHANIVMVESSVVIIMICATLFTWYL